MQSSGVEEGVKRRRRARPRIVPITTPVSTGVGSTQAEEAVMFRFCRGCTVLAAVAKNEKALLAAAMQDERRRSRREMLKWPAILRVFSEVRRTRRRVFGASAGTSDVGLLGRVVRFVKVEGGGPVYVARDSFCAGLDSLGVPRKDADRVFSGFDRHDTLLADLREVMSAFSWASSPLPTPGDVSDMSARLKTSFDLFCPRSGSAFITRQDAVTVLSIFCVMDADQHDVSRVVDRELCASLGVPHSMEQRDVSWAALRAALFDSDTVRSIFVRSMADALQSTE